MQRDIVPKEIIFHAGPTPSASPLQVDFSKVVLLVGPNNSGKSLSLREIEEMSQGGSRNTKVIKDITVDFPDDGSKALEMLEPFIQQRPEDPTGRDRYKVQVHDIAGGSHSYNFTEEQFERALNEDPNKSSLYQWLLRPYTVRLDGRNRFDLVSRQSLGSMRSEPQNHLARLFRNTEAQERARVLIKEAFGLYLVLDSLDTGNLRIRLSSEEPPEEVKEPSIRPDNQQFVDEAVPIEEYGDGVQAYTGIISALLSLSHRIILLDEPEAFLHPPLVQRLGGVVSRLAREREGSVVVATHSPDFLLGCLSSTADVTVVRLTYHEDKATASALDQTRIKEVLFDPLLRSTGVASGLFHRSVIVTEADKDRVFYEEINRRLLDDERGVEDCRFINAQNWQTVSRLVDPLREVGIPAAAIIDLDTISGGEGSWEQLYEACSVPSEKRDKLEDLREKVDQAFEDLPTDAGKRSRLKRLGVDALSGEDAERAQELLDELAEHGIFLVPVGELESWYDVGGGKSNWLPKVFDKIGRFEDDESYTEPGTAGVWGFIDRIGTWVDRR